MRRAGAAAHEGPPRPLTALIPLIPALIPLISLLIPLTLSPVSAETLGAIGAFLPPVLLNNFVEIVKSASDTCEALPLELLYSRQHTAELPLTDVLQFWRGGGRRALRLARAHHQLPPHSPPHSSALVLYVPGWWNTPTDESSDALVRALLARHPSVLVLDTRLSFCRGYLSAASRVNPLAHLIYDFIEKLHRRGLPLSSVHLIGFSLGAHVAGVTGKLVRKRLNGKIGRITALDPARPCFVRPLAYRLDKSDAKFVQVVHSSAGILGLENPIGHVDIYVNGVLVKQPECLDRGITIECDHAQAWKLYSASVVDETALMGRRCLDWGELRSGACSGNMTAVGYGCSDTHRGMFLYKSEGTVKKEEPKLKVFNLFDYHTWWNTR